MSSSDRRPDAPAARRSVPRRGRPSPRVGLSRVDVASTSDRELHMFTEVAPRLVQVVGLAPQRKPIEGGGAAAGERDDVVELELVGGIAAPAVGGDKRAA